MITKELISPRSIVVVGGSDDTTKPGGNALKNLIDTGYKGDIYVVNPKNDTVQGIRSYPSADLLPQVDCAILQYLQNCAPLLLKCCAGTRGVRQ